MDGAHHIIFGPFRLDSQGDRLWRGDQALALRPRSLAVLRYLAAHPGQIIPGHKLIEHIWSGTHVTDTVLRVCIREIREVLEDTSTAPAYIETVRRQGYRFRQDAITYEQHANTHARWTSPQPIVGRQAELDDLQDTLNRSRRRNRHIVLISGETGAGKTALVDCLLSHAAHLESVRIGHGQGIEQDDQGEAYLPVLEALGQLCRAPGGEAVITILRRYAPTWLLQMPALISATELDWLHRHSQPVLRKRMLREMTEAIDAIATTTLLVLVLEDLHWCDTATLELIASLAQQRTDARLLLIGTYRPEEIGPHHQALKRLTQELHGRGLCDVVPLSLLTQADVTAYVTDRLQGHVAAGLTTLLYRYTEGNALFMVNMLDHLIRHHPTWQTHHQWQHHDHWPQDAGVVTFSIPEKLRQLITKRIECFSPDEQHILEAASVTGPEFSVAAVAAGLAQQVETVEQQCEALAGKGALIEEVGLTEWSDHMICGRYRFQHRLYQQVIYERISAARRIQLHYRIGERIEAGYRFQTGEVASTLARHFTAGKAPHRAIVYRCQAGKQALSQNAPQEAGQHCLAALDLIKQLPDTPERSHQALAVHLMLSAVLAITRKAPPPTNTPDSLHLREQSWEASNDDLLCPTLYGLWNRHMLHGECHTAHDLAAQLMQRAQSNPDPTRRTLAHQAYGCTAYWRGDLSPARQYLEASMALYASHPAAPPIPQDEADAHVIALSHLALVLWHQGHADQARTTSQHALSLAAETASAVGQNTTLILTAALHQLCRDVTSVQSHLNTVSAIAIDRALPLWLAWHNALHGWVLTQQHQEEAGQAKIEQALDDLSTTGISLGLPYMLVLLAEAHGQLGQIDAGLSALTTAVEQVSTTEEFVMTPYLDCARANLLMYRGTAADLNQAEADLQHAIATAHRQTAMAWELRASLSLHQLRRQQAHPTRDQPTFKALYQRFTEGFDTVDLQKAKALLNTVDEATADKGVTSAVRIRR